MRLCTSIPALLLTLAVASHACAADDSEQNTLKALLAQSRHLAAAYEAATKLQQEIEHARQTLLGQQAALDHAKQELHRRQIGLVDESEAVHRMDVQSGCPWGTTSDNAGFVSACNEEGHKLDQMAADIARRHGTLDEVARQLNQEQTRLSNATVDNGLKQKANNSDLEQLNAAIEQWQQQMHNFVFHSKAYEQLKRTAAGTQICEVVSRPDTDIALRRAAACLQQLFDGSAVHY